jgi:hypothetical protein
MSMKTLLFSLGCVFAWVVLLPTLVIGGGLALLAHAMLCELVAFVTGHTDASSDASAIREIARRMCGSYSGQVRANWRIQNR